METGTSTGICSPTMSPRIFAIVVPTLLICMGYVDVGKWAVAVDAGSRFGSDLVCLALLFNCTAILCQYLAVRVGVVTGKNLAQICDEEYSRSTCICLGVQAELSMLVLELSRILGIAHGLNLLFGLDLFTCLFLTVADVFVFQFLVTFVGIYKADMLLISIAGFSLLLYVLGILVSQPEIPLAMNGIFPRLGTESAYTLMSLLGASIMPHNLYLHSSIVKRLPNVSMAALCHDHFFAILLMFSGIFLVNYVVMLSAPDVFLSGPVLAFRDTLLLVDQILRSPIACTVFFLVLFFSSEVTALTWNFSGGVILSHLLGISPPLWVHHMALKAFATTLALYCAWISGEEGIYQMLIFSQVVVAMLLPSSVIPLFRAASSRLIMGASKISSFMEILSLSAFLGMVATNLTFMVDLLFGDDDLMNNLRWNRGTLPYSLLFGIACTSLTFMLWLAATPLKSASADIQFRNLDLQKAVPEFSQVRDETESGGEGHIEEEEKCISEKASVEKFSLNALEDPVVDFDVDLPESISDFDHEPFEDISTLSTTSASQHEEPVSSLHEEPSLDGKLVFSAESSPIVIDDKVSSIAPVDTSIIQLTEFINLEEKAEEGEREQVVKDDDAADGWKHEETLAGNRAQPSAFAVDGPGSFRSVSGKGDDVGNGSGSLSRLSGLGRAARRNLAAILDEFWGQLFDFHGQVTQEAKGKGVEMLLGLDQKSVSSVKPESVGTDYLQKYITEAEKGSMFLPNSRDCHEQQMIPRSLESSYDIQMGRSTLPSYMQSLDAYLQSSSASVLGASERRYSSLRLPTHYEERDSQPATIHGYQLTSYLSRIAQDKNMGLMNSTLGMTSVSKPSCIASSYNNQLNYNLRQNGVGSLYDSSVASTATSLMNRLQNEKSYFDNHPLVGSVDSVGSSQYPKKYHSLPDISGLVVPNRSSLADRSTKWSSPIGPRSSMTASPYDHHSFYSNIASRTAGPLAFDELSPPSKLYGDVFSPSSNLSSDSNSLWSQQPSEQWFGIAGKSQADVSLEQQALCRDSEAKLLQSFRYCIAKLLKLEGSEWLFQQNGGSDEELIERVAAREKCVFEAEAREPNWESMSHSQIQFSDHKCGSGSRNDEAALTKFLFSPVPCCGEGCVWKMGLIVYFGVWCIRKILEMSLMESRPELWGKYTYVLNRLQGILDLAFFRPRPPLSPCLCLHMPMQGMKPTPPLSNGFSSKDGKPGSGQQTSIGMLLDLIKDVEAAVSSRKGRTGTAAGDVAFPKGKENLASVLKRYKRRLSNKSVGATENRPGSRKAPMPHGVSFAL